jgi:hypothetical protein
MSKKLLLLIACLGCAHILFAQSLQIDRLKELFGKGKPLKINGGFAANSVFDAGNDMQGRDPFAYYLSGNINLNLYGLIDLPFAFHLTNSGTSYQLPSSPNRLSVSPSYKWVTAHIGDVSMSFSPYTMSGHPFTGVGVELKPEGWELSALYGRFLKAVEPNVEHPEIPANYKRMGYGLKVGKKWSNYQLSMNLFTAHDQENSLKWLPDSLDIALQNNPAASVALSAQVYKNIKISGEYGMSLLTTDTRLPQDKRSGVVGWWNGSNQSTAVYDAFKVHLDLVGESNSIGLGYERIDPEYKTLGAYYFVNDIENITVNATQKFWQDKMNLSISVGYEHDDIERTKANENTRLVGSANLTAQFSERVNANLSYSNFQNYTNVRSNFELINQENPLDLLDTLNFVQLSQNANLNMTVLTKKTETQQQTLSLNFSFQDASAKQGEITQEGSVSEMINTSAAYSCNFLPRDLTVTGAFNLNNSRLAVGNTFTCGPTLDIAKKLGKKKVNLRTSFSYNAGYLNSEKQNEVFLARLNSSYTLAKKHNFNLAYTFQWRSAVNRPNINHSLITAGYAYNF